jgi:hypothetical protein
MLFRPIEDAIQSFYFFVACMDAGEGREQDAVALLELERRPVLLHSSASN